MSTCPYCLAEPAEVARKVWFLQGFVLVARYGTRHFVGCRHCVHERLRKSLLGTMLGGWWSIPWGLMTPFVIVQNLWQFADKPEQEEIRRLQSAGIGRNATRHSR